MRKLFFFLSLFIFHLSLYSQNTKPLADYAKPLQGTEGIILYGRTTPFVTPPFGMTHWTACTRQSGIGVCAYQHLDATFCGIRASHKPAMWMGDYGHVTFMPFTGAIKNKKIGKKALLDHGSEISKPYYYKAGINTANGSRIKVELTSTARCGLMQFTFNKKAKPGILIEASQGTEYCLKAHYIGRYPPRKHDSLPDFNGWIHIDTTTQEITGYNTDRQSYMLGPALPNFKGYFVIRFSERFETNGTWKDKTLTAGNTEQLANSCGAYVTFKKGTKTAHIKIGTSFISIDQARENLEKEAAAKTFDEVKQQTQDEWENYLGRIKPENATRKQRGIFYSAMYHSLLFPRQFSEYGKYYSAFDDKIHNGVSYNDYSLWDTYRAEHPLLILLAPEHVGGMVQSLLQMYDEGGYMPKWPNPTYTSIMIGTHADAVVADAVVKGVKGFDLQKAYEACMKDAMVPPDGDSIKRWADRAPWSSYEARSGLSWYKKLGYVPVDKTNESVANTLEGAYDDFCVAQVAKAAYKMESYDMLMARSKNYVNLYNRATGFMAPRKADGTWFENPKTGFTEGSKWTYLFCVQHDVPGLINLMGRDTFLRMLNRNFNGVHYIHENEPGHHYCYLFNYIGAAWRTQQLVARNRAVKYHNIPNAMLGDDDCGQMSAWYIFSSLGFYPVTPGTDAYAIGTPLFKKATLYPEPTNRDKKFEIIAHNVSSINIYVQSATLNGKKLEEPFLHHADIVNGGQLIFEMGAKPNKNW